MVENELDCQLVVEIDPKGKLLAAAVGTDRQTREPRQVGGQGVTVGRVDPAVGNPGDAVGAYSHIGLQKAVPYTVLDARSGRVVMRLPSGPELGARCGFCRKGPSQHQNGDGLAHRTDAAIALHGEARSKKPAFDQIRVIEIAAAEKRCGVPAPLAHCARVGNTGRPEQQALAPLGSGDNSVRTKGAAGCAINRRQRAQFVLLGTIIDTAAAATVEAQTHDVVRPAGNMQHHADPEPTFGNIAGTKAHSMPGCGDGFTLTRAVGKNM